MNILLKEYSKLEWGIGYVFIALDYKLRELFGKTGFNPFWIMNTTNNSRRDWRRCKTDDLHIKWTTTDAWHRLATVKLLVVRTYFLIVRICERLSFILDIRGGIRWLRFLSDPEWICKWMRVWHWISFHVN